MSRIIVFAALAALCLGALPASALSNCSFTNNRFGIPTKESMYQCALQLSREHGIDPCFAVIGMNHETGEAMVGRYSVGFDAGKHGEKYDESKPDLGLFFNRFSYGLGPMQVTLFPQSKGVLGTKKWCQPGVPSIQLDGACFTAQGLVTPLRGIRAGVLAYKKCGAKGGNPNSVWPCVAGVSKLEDIKNAKVKAEVRARIAETQTCIGRRDPSKSFTKSTRCRGDAPVSQKQCKAESAALEQQGHLGYNCDAGCVDIFAMPVKNSQLVRDDTPSRQAKSAPAKKRK